MKLKITHRRRRWGTPQNFCLAFIDKFEKNNYLLKKLSKWADKKCKNLKIYDVVSFLKKIKETLGDFIILNMCTKNLDDMIYSSYISMLRYSV